ncbi:LysM domain-containing protein [Gordonia sp. ABSL1-1]|uniref:LysM peptidoglycan-binding domain-containing protein n=1 Tax=Gordonia sp. ABSL1-1 TaxID=3053923 RepID=UPI0025728090|nr:LysM domain-containing protein [Gordonia sp. ABSL1-1]MDL9936817.1 LysM domain-containing protein [Gordonia sp. ABSL1-1]
MAFIYTVVAGDSLSSIAQRFYGDASLFPIIAQANGIADPNHIEVGARLTIPDRAPGGRTYTVVTGDTLSGIAQRFYGDPTLFPIIARANGIANPDLIFAGQTLTIPDRPPRPAPTPPPMPPMDFAGQLPFASEEIGVYQPLAGWLGRLSTQRAERLTARADFADDAFFGEAATSLTVPSLRALVDGLQGVAAQGFLSPVGLVQLFRQYFFEFDTFLGAPSGHVWITPGGTVELVESSIRKTQIERFAEQSEQSTRKAEETLTDQDDLADAVKQENATDTKLGASATAGGKFAGFYHADATASFSVATATKKSSESTHKRSRTQSAKVSSEIIRNFKTTFRTVSETTDTTSRRYVISNPTTQLVNYELRRKMRRVGVQMQHVGTRLSWQTFMDDPGATLGLGELIDVVPAPDTTSVKKPDAPPPLVVQTTQFTDTFPIIKFPGTQDPPEVNHEFVFHDHNAPNIRDHDNARHIVASRQYTPVPPGNGYVLSAVRLLSAKSQGSNITFVPQLPFDLNDPALADPASGKFTLFVDRLNTGDKSPIQLDFSLTWQPPATDPVHEQYARDLAEYEKKIADVQRRAYVDAVRDRVTTISQVRSRSPEDLRWEERQLVYGSLIRNLKLFEDPHLGAELLRQVFDVDEMLYFVAPDYWRPGVVPKPPVAENNVGHVPVPKVPDPDNPSADVLAGDSVVGWYSHTASNNAIAADRSASAQWRINYPITSDSQAAPLGSSLGWLIQIDGDERRNQFLNAAWVKAVLPIRPGHEVEAMDWLAKANVEGEAGLGMPYPVQPGDPAEYQGKTVREVLQILATDLQKTNADITNTLATEKVFETGFDPLEGGFRPAAPFELFDQWIEVLPTDQIAAVEVTYDPRTGKQL